MKPKGRLEEEYEKNDWHEIQRICLAAFFAVDAGCLIILIIHAIFCKS